ncbi:hypothetical protein, partial [Thiolapillus sp.]|uniref:hypothetical protein n=1 Tax=Thiolapillus sp. TaxID=2017437 RepID=UPI003AF5832C
MTRTAGAPIGCQRPSRFWGLGCPKIYHEAEDTLGLVYPAAPFSGKMTLVTTPTTNVLKTIHMLCWLVISTNSIP